MQWEPINQVPSPTSKAGYLLTNDGSSVNWATFNSFLPTQTGQSGNVLTSNGTTASWQQGNGFANPLTTFGDIFIGGTGVVNTRCQMTQSFLT